MKIFVTGGGGFIGSTLIKHLIRSEDCSILNFDKLTYATNVNTMKSVADSDRYVFSQGCLTDRKRLQEAFTSFKPDAVLHLAAESHVDRSIDDPSPFINSNVVGTFNLLEVSRTYLKSSGALNHFRFINVSTDEVFGSLDLDQPRFVEEQAYKPRSPYSASKACSDHLVRAWIETYNFPALITNCSNNYGPFQHPEKLIPLTIQKCLQKERIPVYGDGLNIRDWLHVDDHVSALLAVLNSGKIGETYLIGGSAEKTNLEVVKAICKTFQDLQEGAQINFEELISFVGDRPGHDKRYAINASKIETQLGWRPTINFENGIQQSVNWYMNNQDWVAHSLKGNYDLSRLGTCSTPVRSQSAV